MEILAPAGNMQSLTAAVRCKADAVYLGAKNMSARQMAENFDSLQLKEAVEYCRRRGVKVYITLNTLIGDRQMRDAYKITETALGYGADAFIVQDLGLAAMMRRCFPGVRLHASTQCSAVTPDGFKRLRELGFIRAVVPREMSLDEIIEIKKSTGMELEMFVHGALCMSVSGQCYMSAMLGSRSGNRGLCAQPCRLSFSCDNSKSCDLSLKDLSLVSKIKEIEEAGITSLKIEGRMKRPEYVAAAVTACRKSLCGAYTSDDEKILKSVFSRSGFTDGYFTGDRKDMFGTRQKEDVVSASGVLKQLSHLYDNETPLLKMDMEFVCRENENTLLNASSGGRTVKIVSAPPQKALTKPLSDEEVILRLSKLGGTQYFAGSIKTDIQSGLIVPARQINSMRRSAVEKLDVLPDTNFASKPYEEKKKTAKNSTPYYTARFENTASIPENHPFRRIFIPIDCDVHDFEKYGAGIDIPRGLFGCQALLEKKLKFLYDSGVRKALCPDIGTYTTARRLGFKVFSNFTLNIFNSETASQFSSPMLSAELTVKQANSIDADDTGIVAYGKIPLMLARNCPVKNRIGCSKCKKKRITYRQKRV